METAHLSTLAAEPATIIYLVTGAAGLLFTRLRVSGSKSRPSVLMLFCKKSTRQKLQRISLT
jgi:hypothetical protein